MNNAGTVQSTGGLLSLLLPFAVFLGVFYFFVMRPQAIQEKKRREMLAGLRKGNTVVTVGGIYGKIVDIKDDDITVEIADRVNVRMTRQAVARVLGKQTE